MKRLTKSTLANTLQIVAILIMFGYPGCSSGKVSKETASAAGMPTVTDTVVQVRSNLLKPPAVQQQWILLKQ
jgi:hypothetical protein